MFVVSDEPELLAELQKTYYGLAKVESWPLVGPANTGGLKSYRYTDTSGASYPAFTTPATASDPLAILSTSIDANVLKLARQNATSTRPVFIVRKKS